MRSLLEHAPFQKGRPRGALVLLAAVLALIAVSVIALPRYLAVKTLPPNIIKSTPADTMPILVGSLWNMQSTSAGVEWLFGGQVVYRSTDHGAHWADVSPTGVAGQPQVASAFGSDQAWLAVPSGQLGLPLSNITFYGTSNAGVNWQKLGTTAVSGSWIHEMTFVDSTHGWLLISLGAATGSEAVSVWGTTDGGRSWSELARSPMPQMQSVPGQLSSGCDKNGITFNTETTGWMTGLCGEGKPYLYRTADGGNTWQAQTLPPAACQTSRNLGYSAEARPPVFLNQSFGLLPDFLVLSAGQGARRYLVVYITHDEGRTWIASLPVGDGQVMAAVRTGYWVIEVPPNQVDATHNGQDYKRISSDTDLSQTQQLAFADEQTGLTLTVLSAGGYELLRTSDGGAHWSAVSFGPEAAITAVDNAGLVPNGMFPGQPGSGTCVIPGGGPAPGIRVPGTCATAASPDTATATWYVTVSEAWDARQFHGQADPVTGQLSHSWTYAVAGNGQVVLASQSGNFPPQEVS